LTDNLDRAEVAFRRALEINPELPIAHKLYAQLEVDLGRAPDAMARLLECAKSADPELFAGLVSTCRYCGLLDASAAADDKAKRLEPPAGAPRRSPRSRISKRRRKRACEIS
jgi:tetratricopeptide (TPR) repeat protein